MHSFFRNLLTLKRQKKQPEIQVIPATWDDLLGKKERKLYAGAISRPDDFKNHIGIHPFSPKQQHILHDVTQPMPIPDNSVDAYQSEDVFEHIHPSKLPTIFNEIYRVLKPGAYFRLCLPDYQFDLYKNRSLKDEKGEIIFDPGGGGDFVNGEVINGGHVWFPTYQSLLEIIDRSDLKKAHAHFMHYYDNNGISVTKKINYDLGTVSRTPDFDERAQTPYRAMSIVVDFIK